MPALSKDPATIITDLKQFKESMIGASRLLNRGAQKVLSARDSHDDIETSEELDFLRRNVESLVVEQKGAAKQTLLDVFKRVLTDDRSEAIDAAADFTNLWSSPGLEELGRIQIVNTRASRTGLTLADVLPVFHNSEQNNQWLYRVDPRDKDDPCWMTYGKKWWTVLLYTKYRAWTKTHCNGTPFVVHRIMTDLSDGCGHTVGFRFRKPRESTSSVEVSHAVWGGAGLGVGSKHRACVTSSFGSCVKAGCMVDAPSSAYTYV
jgi:hypothetical protein